jgi:cupin fold WbuC family metalloprotein
MSQSLRYEAHGPGIFYARDGVVFFGAADVDFVVAQARLSPTRRARICAHPTPAARQHVMLIAVCQDSFLRPQQHIGRSETLLVLQGQGRQVVFGEAGKIEDVVPLAPATAPGHFFCNMTPGVFHALLVDTPELVYLETTLGPFDRTTTVDAPWIPQTEPPGESLAKLRREADTWAPGL